MSNSAIDIDALSTAERWDLIERLWASLGDEPSELTSGQRAELDRRLVALDDDIAHGRPLGVSWHDVRARLFRESAKT